MKKDKKLAQAKLAAKRIVERSAAMNITVAYNQALELVAVDRGFATWHAFAADMRKPEVVAPVWRKSQGPMTTEQYLGHDAPNCCPVCGSSDIQGESVSIEGRQAVQECSCSDCDAEWEDRYELASYNLISRGTSGEDFVEPAGDANLIIFSSSEGGYWSNETGWGNKAGATRFTEEQSRAVSLPFSRQNDARWVALDGPTPQWLHGVYGYSIVVHDAAGNFLASGLGYGPNRSEAQWEFANAKGLRPYHALHFVVEEQARVRTDLEALLAWWARNDASEDALDELVYEMVQQKGMPQLNATSNEGEQDELLEDADAQASSINNEGIEAQLTYLVKVCEPHVLLTRLAVDIGLKGLPNLD
ncbi:glyoxalase superfamily protein [Burkholderia cenocepacia]|uniref:glyoxalase superfamily protein n=1 Tax=Burkholderia cenocepacia TaxID=95486 RepID=UPI000761D121|nr:glyoxalase superfamily protein [Burkholderia cenocepacia]KWU23444.1 hypothetical protein AS149_37275 [Burkholderia cenocepacia]